MSGNLEAQGELGIAAMPGRRILGRSQLLVQPGLGTVGTHPSGSCARECAGNVREPGRLCQLGSVTGAAASPAASTCGAGQDLAAGADLAARSRTGSAVFPPGLRLEPAACAAAAELQWAGLAPGGGGGRGKRDYSRRDDPKFRDLSFPCASRPAPDASQPGTSMVIPLQGQPCPGALRGPSGSRWSGRELGSRWIRSRRCRRRWRLPGAVVEHPRSASRPFPGGRMGGWRGVRETEPAPARHSQEIPLPAAGCVGGPG